MKVYYNEQGLPFKDSALTIPYSIIGSEFTGANNTTEIRFYAENIDNELTWVANIKLQDGTLTYRLLTPVIDEDNKTYQLLEMDNGITSKKGFIYLGLNGYGGETLIEEVEDVLTINGNPTIVATGTISIALNYTPIVVPLGTSIEPTEIQQILSALSIKQDKFNLNNVRGYDTLALATTDLPNLIEGQIIIVKGTPTEIYQVQSGALVDLTVNKATRDSLGNVIKDSYVSAVYPTYNATADKLFIETYGVEDGLLANNEVILPKATTTKNGLMSSTDKTKLDALPTKGQYDSDMVLKVPTNRKILGIDLTDDILLGEFKTALGEATDVLSGLMSATDKARLNALHALLGVESDADATVNTINEVLAIFNNYPEGADLVNALAGKVDKVAGKGLSKNDFTDILKAKLDSLLSGDNYYNKEYIDALKDLNGWSSSLITQSALTNGQTVTKATLSDFDVIKLFARNTSTNEIDTDSFDTSVGLVNDYEYRLFDNANIKFVIGATNCTFTDTVGGYELKIIGQKYVAQEAENVVYDNTVKNLLVATNVQDAIDEITDEVLTPTYDTVLQPDLITEITATNNVEIIDDAGVLIKVEGKTPASLEKADLIAQGVKNDSGVLFSELSDAEIEEQLAIWLVQGYPTHINKIISKSDNLFDSEFYPLTDLESENLIPNSDLLLDANANGIPDGFSLSVATTNKVLANGEMSFTTNATYQSFAVSPSPISVAGQKAYCGAYVKSDKNRIRLITVNGGGSYSTQYHSGSNEYEYLSFIATATSTTHPFYIEEGENTNPASNVSVQYMVYINIADLVFRGILPSGLTDAQYKAILDSACNRSKTPMVNVPLRETSLISVEPSTAYKFIKASANNPIHKVVEYATDGQVVKVTTLSYTDHKATFTTQSQTTKIKLVSDLMNRVPNLVSNSDLLIPKASPNENQPLGFYYAGATTDISLVNGIAKFTATSQLGRFVNNFSGNNNKFYVFGSVKANSNLVRLTANVVGGAVSHSGSGNFEYLSTIQIIPDGNGLLVADYRSSGWTPIEVDYVGAYNITTFINAGVVNDTGTLFSRLTNDEIKEQMDIWVQNGFPDQVIHALYPNGVDSAIAIKYNDADDIFRPQQIDELPLGITLRSGEYWQDGYVVKQNGNAEYYPLPTTLSAWNYGQLQAVYDSGIPADFTIKFAQNTKAQVQTNSDYLIEARERLDTLRRNQELLIEKLGVDVEADDYDSFVGITSAEYEYFGLEGIEEGDELNIDAYGQGVLNLLPNTITATQTAVGLTITYDDTTGIVTVNGTSTMANNFILKTGMVLGSPQLATGTTVQLMRYFVDGTVNLNGSYIGYLLAGTSVSNRINENSESLYDPYINASGGLKASGALSGVAGTSGQSLIFQVFASGMVFTDFKFKLGVFEGLTLQPFVMPSLSNSTAVDVYNKTANKLNTAYTATPSAVSGITVTYDPLSQEYIFDGTASGANSITLSTNLFSVKSGDRLSIKRVYQSGDITAVSALPTISLISGATTIVSNSIYKMTAPEGQTPTPDVTFNTGTASADLTNVTLKLTFASGDVFTSYRCRIMIHDKSSDIGYVGYSSTKIGSISLEAGARGELSFTAIDFGILSFVPQQNKLNVVFGTSLTDLSKTNLEYNAGIQSPNRRISELNERLSNVDNVFRDKVIAIWGDSRESNNPTSDPNGIGDQKDTSYPAILAKKLGATVLNFGLSGGCWAENTTQQDASSAIVNRVNSQDVGASADVILISSMNDFKLATPLGSPDTSNKTASTFYGAMRLTYDRLATKYPAKKIWLVLPQKRFDEATNYGGGDYLSYRKAQIEVAREYGIPTIDLYNNFPNTKPTFYATYMLNDTHFSALGNDYVAEIIMRSLLGNGNSGVVETLPALPTSNGTYTLKLTVLNGVNTFSWVLDN